MSISNALFNVLNAAVMGEKDDLTDFGKGQIIMFRRVGQSTSETQGLGSAHTIHLLVVLVGIYPSMRS